MANWAKLQEDTIGLPVYKRAKHGIHFDKGNGEVLANFVGKPCHYQDGGLWKPIDTKLLLGGDGFYGCPHSPVRISKEGRVKVDGTNYQQYTELPSATGLVDNDRIVRTFSFGEQRMWVTEDGYRSEIQLNRIPTLAEARKVITSESGTLSKSYLKSLTVATDANGDIHTVTTLSAFRTWLASAVFPVVIDPDFGGDAADADAFGVNADWATARSTSTNYNSGAGGKLYFGCRNNYTARRAMLLFDTSTIDDSATITQVNLKIYVTDDDSSADFTVLIVKYDWSAYAADIANATNREIAFDGILAGTQETNNLGSTAGGYTGAKTSGNLATDWVSKTGFTYYGLVSSRDYENTTPTNSYEQLGFGSSSNATESYRPVLTVTYTAGGALLKVNMNAQMSNLTGGIHG